MLIQTVYILACPFNDDLRTVEHVDRGATQKSEDFTDVQDTDCMVSVVQMQSLQQSFALHV